MKGSIWAVYVLLLAGAMHGFGDEPFRDIRRDISYREGDPSTTMDLYYPPETSDLYPTQIYVHGGGWQRGSKAVRGRNEQFFARLAEEGFLGISVEYRTMQAEQDIYMRESTMDVLDAVRYVFAHASDLGVDTNRVVIWGSSAGGHLALMGAMASQNPQLSASPELEDVPVQMKGVVAWFPPTDLVNYETISVEKNGKLRPLSDRIGCLQKDNPSVYVELSPLENLNDTFPPALIFHGDQDRIVHLEHSLRFKQKADRLGVSCTLQVVKGAGHGFKVKPGFKECQPDADSIVEESARFLTDQVNGLK